MLVIMVVPLTYTVLSLSSVVHILIPPDLLIQKSNQPCFCIHAIGQPLIGYLIAAIIFMKLS